MNNRKEVNATVMAEHIASIAESDGQFETGATADTIRRCLLTQRISESTYRKGA